MIHNHGWKTWNTKMLLQKFKEKWLEWLQALIFFTTIVCFHIISIFKLVLSLFIITFVKQNIFWKNVNLMANGCDLSKLIYWSTINLHVQPIMTFIQFRLIIILNLTIASKIPKKQQQNRKKTKKQQNKNKNVQIRMLWKWQRITNNTKHHIT